MNRELIRHSEGYWSIVDDFGKEICRFKIGDRVNVMYTYLYGFMEFTIDLISVDAEGNIYLLSDKNDWNSRMPIQFIKSMEVIQ